MKNTFKLLVLTAVVLVVASVVAAGVARGWSGTQYGEASRASVVSFVWMNYNSQVCGPDERTRYQIFFSEWRWYREYLDRGVRATIRHGAQGTTCAGWFDQGYQDGSGPFQVCWAACTGGDPHWSQSYISFGHGDWEYIGEPHHIIDVQVGAWANSTVFNRYSGNTIGSMCVDAMVLGSRC